jgi:hypothetical protein
LAQDRALLRLGMLRGVTHHHLASVAVRHESKHIGQLRVLASVGDGVYGGIDDVGCDLGVDTLLAQGGQEEW